MTSLAEFATVNTPLVPPKDWEPLVHKTQTAGGRLTGGQATVAMEKANATERELLEKAGVDPDAFMITSDVSFITWQALGKGSNYATDGNRVFDLYRYKFAFGIRTGETQEEVSADLQEIIGSILKRTPKAPLALTGDDALVVVFSDWQMGKNSEHTVEGVRRSVQRIKDRVRCLRKSGRTVDTLFIACTGDLLEGCDGHYAQQTFIVDLDRRGQCKVTRRLISWAIRELAPLFRRIVVAAVGGNHGEYRKKGKSFTTFADNDDVAVLEQVQEIFENREGYDHVEFQIAHDELSAVVDIKGVNIGLTHGHLASKGPNPQAKQKAWWGDQFWDEGSVAPKAKILITSHYHHLTISNYGTRTHIQSPAYDGGSKWFSDMSGMNSPDGLLTFVVDPSHPLGWDDCKVL